MLGDRPLGETTIPALHEPESITSRRISLLRACSEFQIALQHGVHKSQEVAIEEIRKDRSAEGPPKEVVDEILVSWEHDTASLIRMADYTSRWEGNDECTGEQ